MGMKANTKKGDDTCDYFIKLEELCSLMTKYTIEKLKLESREAIEIKDQEIQIAKGSFTCFQEILTLEK
jgi:hypothetical protein